jgi:DNA recombination protein RmuC
VNAIVTAVAITTALAVIGVAVLLWRLVGEARTASDRAFALLAEERVRSERQQDALSRYEVTFASISGRGQLGEQVLVQTARALGLREGMHFLVQTDLAGGGRARPDLVLLVGPDRMVPVDAKTSLATWYEAVETADPTERLHALRIHARSLRARAAELIGRGYEQWADAVYGTLLFVPSDAAAVAALEADPALHRWLLERRVFLCGPTGFAIAAAAALHARSERAIAHDIDQLRSGAGRAHRAAALAIEAANTTGTHLDRLAAARRRELEALDTFRSAVTPLAEFCGRAVSVPLIRDAVPFAVPTPSVAAPVNGFAAEAGIGGPDDDDCAAGA